MKTTKTNPRKSALRRAALALAHGLSIAIALAAGISVATGARPSFAQTPAAEPSTESAQPDASQPQPPGEQPEGEPAPRPGRPGAPTPGDGSPVQPGIAPQRQSEQEKAEEILQRIGETLRQVEQLMVEMSFDTESTGAGQTKVVEEIDKLLSEAGRQQQAVLDGIDELIEMARQQQQQQQQQGGSGSQQRQQQNQSEQDRQQDSSQQDQQNPQNQQDQKNGGQPENSEQGKGEPNKPRRPGDPAPEEHWSQDVAGRWGALPPKLQELIRQGDPAKFPPQYREMLEEYYKRLSDQDK